MSEVFNQLADKLRLWREKPQVMVRELFHAQPDPWQDAVLEAFPHTPRIAMTACKGPGKTALLAWLAWNFLLTRPHPKIAASSITEDNLADNLWAEMAKWQKRAPILEAAFAWHKTRIESREHPETWWMSARSWAQRADKSQQANTLAGLHADYLLFLLDESGGIPDAVMAAAEGGLSSGIEAHIVQAGNPTHLEGPLYRANTIERDLWHMTHITGDPDDAMRSSRVSADWARTQIKKYGRDNPWVQVNVYGRFPPSSLNALIGPDEVRAAMSRHRKESEYSFAARVLGVDVALYGGDASVIFPRQGLAAFEPIALRNVDSTQGGGRLARKMIDWQADACFIDDTGGFGAGWLARLRELGHNPRGVHFSGAPLNPQYANKRAEMWMEAVQWIKDGGALPDCPELLADLTVPTYSFSRDRILIESKEQIRDRLQRSPDWGDALALTFAWPVVRGRGLDAMAEAGVERDHDPWGSVTN